MQPGIFFSPSSSSYIPMKITQLFSYQAIPKVWEVCGGDEATIPHSKKDVHTVKCNRKEGGNKFQQEESVYTDHCGWVHYSCLRC